MPTDATKRTEPGEDLDEAKRRLVKIRPPFVSLVDMPANLQPFHVIKALKELEKMPDQKTAAGGESEWVFSSEMKDAIVDTLGTASQMIGDLLALTRDAGESGQDMAGALPESFQSKVAEIVAMLQGEDAPDAGEAQTLSLEPDKMIELRQALEAALSVVAAQKEDIANPETKATLESAGTAMLDAAGTIKSALEAARKAATKPEAEAKGDDDTADTTKAMTIEQAEAFSKELRGISNALCDLGWKVKDVAREEMAAQAVANPSAALQGFAERLMAAAASAGAEPEGEAMEASAADTKAEGEDVAKPEDKEEEMAADTEKAGAVFNKRNRERLESALKLISEAVEGARTAPDPGVEAAKAEAAKAEAVALKKAAAAEAEQVAKARPRSRVEQPDSGTVAKPFVYCDDIAKRVAVKEAAAAAKAEAGRK